MTKLLIYGFHIGNHKKESKSHNINPLAGHLLSIISLIVICLFILLGGANRLSGNMSYS